MTTSAVLQKNSTLNVVHSHADNSTHKSRHRLVISTENGLRCIPTQEINFIEADGNYVHIHLINEKKCTVSKTLKHYVDQLFPCGFTRIHQSYLVNIHSIEYVLTGNQSCVRLFNGKKLPVARRRSKSLKHELQVQFAY